jgi:hypothetical protein
LFTRGLSSERKMKTRRVTEKLPRYCPHPSAHRGDDMTHQINPNVDPVLSPR